LGSTQKLALDKEALGELECNHDTGMQCYALARNAVLCPGTWCFSALTVVLYALRRAEICSMVSPAKAMHAMSMSRLLSYDIGAMLCSSECASMLSTVATSACDKLWRLIAQCIAQPSRQNACLQHHAFGRAQVRRDVCACCATLQVFASFAKDVSPNAVHSAGTVLIMTPPNRLHTALAKHQYRMAGIRRDIRIRCGRQRHAHLRVDVDEGEAAAEQHRGAKLEEEDVPDAEAALQGQAVDEHAQEPLQGHAAHVDAVPREVLAQRREALVHLCGQRSADVNR